MNKIEIPEIRMWRIRCPSKGYTNWRYFKTKLGAELFMLTHFSNTGYFLEEIELWTKEGA